MLYCRKSVIFRQPLFDAVCLHILIDTQMKCFSFSVINEVALFKFFSHININIFFVMFCDTDDVIIWHSDNGELSADPHRGISSSIFLTVLRVCECQEHVLIVQYAVYGKSAKQRFVRGMDGKKASGL